MIIIALVLAAILVVLSATAIIVLLVDFIQFAWLRHKTYRQKHRYDPIPAYYNVRPLQRAQPRPLSNRRSAVYASLPSIPSARSLAQLNAQQDQEIRRTKEGILTTSFTVHPVPARNAPDDIQIVYEQATDTVRRPSQHHAA